MSGIYRLQIKVYQRRIVKIFWVLGVLLGGLNYTARAQSTDQSFPTAITSNEISGRIAARDIGDARLTEFFYVFNATQGDVFINVVTKNLNADIDIFTADNLRPLTKITTYADANDSETGRVIYLRQAAKLILRIEGRTPNDEAATFSIKFAGSFTPAEAAAEIVQPTVKSSNQTDVRVNSVGTIIEVKQKPTPTPKIEIAKIKPEKPKKPAKPERKSAEDETLTEEKKADEAAIAETDAEPKIDQPAEVVKPAKPVENKKETVAREKTPVKTETKRAEKPKSPQPLPPAALENIRLIIVFKDNTKIERPMSDVLKVGVDKGILTVITKDGIIGRYSILDVEKMTIE